jgi:hypothetical protein
VFHESLVRLHFSNQDIRNFLQIYEKYEPTLPSEDTGDDDAMPSSENVTVKLLRDNSEDGGPSERDRIMNKIACEWLKENKDVYVHWLHSQVQRDKEDIYIGGIFPVTLSTKMYKSEFC